MFAARSLLSALFFIASLGIADSKTEKSPQADSAPKKAHKPEKKKGKGFTCSSKDDKRVVSIQRTEAGGCEVLYTKAGETQSVASAAHETEYCDNVAMKMKATLKGAAFHCD